MSSNTTSIGYLFAAYTINLCRLLTAFRLIPADEQRAHILLGKVEAAVSLLRVAHDN